MVKGQIKVLKRKYASPKRAKTRARSTEKIFIRTVELYEQGQENIRTNLIGTLNHTAVFEKVRH